MNTSSKLLNNGQINDLANDAGYAYRVLKAIIQVESGQHGFDPATGKIIIQFEPSWFKREYKEWAQDTTNITWQSNGVGNQEQEWLAFDSAFAENADAAMQSTSIGMMQVMGFHYAEIGFKTVGSMWDSAKQSEFNQILLAIEWIKTVPALDLAIKNKDWAGIAYHYNGANYQSFRYDTRLLAAYNLTQEFQTV